MKEEMYMVIYPFDEQYVDVPVWCVYGPSSFPVIICCKIRRDVHTAGLLNIWGYSIYGGIPGFRTIGRDLRSWIIEEEDRFHDRPIFFDVQDDALKHLKNLTTPVDSIV